MFPNNNDNFPRTAGGYSIESYEPAVIHPEQRQRAEDLIRFAFTEQKPVTTIRRMIPRMPLMKMATQPLINNMQNIKPVPYNNQNTNRIQIVNSNQNNFYRFNNFQKIKPTLTVKSLNNNKSNTFMYQNLIQMNNGYKVPNKNANFQTNTGNNFIMPNFNNPANKPILRSNSMNNHSKSFLGRKIVETRIISGPTYKPLVYKRDLF